MTQGAVLLSHFSHNNFSTFKSNTKHNLSVPSLSKTQARRRLTLHNKGLEMRNKCDLEQVNAALLDTDRLGLIDTSDSDNSAENLVCMVSPTEMLNYLLGICSVNKSTDL